MFLQLLWSLRVKNSILKLEIQNITFWMFKNVFFTKNKEVQRKTTKYF